MGELLKPVLDRKNADWTIEQRTKGWWRRLSNWREIAPLMLRARNPKMGLQVSYGMGPDGYDQWTIEQPNGGGSVIAPYVIIGGELYVGAIKQKRSLSGRFVRGVPRGFSNAGENHAQTATREFAEETGLSLRGRMKDLGGRPVNPDTAFLVANSAKGEGVKYFGLALRPEEVQLRRKASDPKKRVYMLTPELQQKMSDVNEKISPEGLRFFHVDLLRGTLDGHTLIAMARLMTKHPQ